MKFFWVILVVACTPATTVEPVVIAPLPLAPSADVQVSAPIAVSGGKCAPSKIVCTNAGCLYAAPDFKTESISAQTRACTAGRAEACTSLGVRTSLGEGIASDQTKAQELLERACALHDSLACVDASKLRHDETFEGWERRCNAGIGEACLEAGNDARFGAAASTHTPADGARFYERGCDLGIGNACARLGYHAGVGLAMPKNDTRMFELYDKACRCGDDTGCSGVGYDYRDGRGVPQDYERARSMFTKLCQRGVQASCVHLGYMVEMGMGAPVDYARAHTIYEGACNGRQLDPEGSQGCYMLGQQYRDARGVAQDDSRAYTLFDQACQMQQALACGELGRWFRDGRYVGKDKVRALELFDSACSHGAADGCHDADALRATP